MPRRPPRDTYNKEAHQTAHRLNVPPPTTHKGSPLKHHGLHQPTGPPSFSRPSKLAHVSTVASLATQSPNAGPLVAPGIKPIDPLEHHQTTINEAPRSTPGSCVPCKLNSHRCRPNSPLPALLHLHQLAIRWCLQLRSRRNLQHNQKTELRSAKGWPQDYDVCLGR